MVELPRSFADGNTSGQVVAADEFSLVSEQLFQVVFGSNRPKAAERVDFAVLLSWQGKLAGFVSCYEHQAGELYLQYGGALPNFRNTPAVLRSYQCVLSFLLDHYAALLTRIENSNTAMLKLALHCGWMVIGLRVASNGVVLLELLNRRIHPP